MKSMTRVALSGVLGAVAMLSVSATAITCQEDCKRYARQQQAWFCDRIGGGSACATSEPLFNQFYQECLANFCSAP